MKGFIKVHNKEEEGLVRVGAISTITKSEGGTMITLNNNSIVVCSETFEEVENLIEKSI